MKTILFSIIAFLLSYQNLKAEIYPDSLAFQNTSDFVIVLDAGHGGDDGGNSHKGVHEKDVALKTVLELGKRLEQQNGIKVIYTRKTDVFVELNKRADIANKAKADLFVSIHCNSFHKSSANGNETWVLGLTKSKKNLDVVMKENSVILLEDNYEENYGGFDPKDPSSYATGVLAQEIFMEESIELAAMIQNNFATNVKRVNRGVKQNWFVVLLQSYMPSVLVELGFLSNTSERNYLLSKKGREEVVKSVYDGIMNYVKTRDVNIYDVPGTIEKEEQYTEEAAQNKEYLYKVQLAASGRKLPAKSYNFKKLPNISREKEGKIYRYFTGETYDLNEVNELLKQAKDKGYSSAFIVKFKNGERSRL
ncbi:MAG: N-acetylmuramoyl-L-alanine amidase [Nonlabens sp.]